MRRLLLTIPALLVLALSAALAGGAVAATKGSSLLPLPHWLKGAETQTLDRVFGGATPIHTTHIPYPRKVAVVFEFGHVVICRTCSGPSAATVPRGRVIRVSFDRQTHRLNGAMQFCESRGSLPRGALCLRR
jgi:hypothetical protein